MLFDTVRVLDQAIDTSQQCPSCYTPPSHHTL